MNRAIFNNTFNDSIELFGSITKKEHDTEEFEDNKVNKIL